MKAVVGNVLEETEVVFLGEEGRFGSESSWESVVEEVRCLNVDDWNDLLVDGPVEDLLPLI